MIDIEPLLLKIKNRKPVVIAVPILLGLMAGGLLVVKPAMGRLMSIKGEIEGLKQKESSYNMILESEKKVGTLKEQFFGDKTWLIEQLNTIGEKTGFSIISILPEDQRKVGDFLDRVSVRIEAEGNYHQLGEFTSQVESLSAYVKILGVDINANTSTAQQGPLGAPAARAKRSTSFYNISMSVGVLVLPLGA